MAVQQFKNCPIISSPSTAWSTLSGALAAGATSLTVASATPFPSSPQFQLTIGDEILTVTAVAGAVFTVTRGAESTVDADHADGASVFCPVTAGGLALLPAAVSTTGIVYGTDTTLARTSAGTMKLSASGNTSLLLGNGGNAESGAIYWNGNNFVLGTQGAAGAGTARDVILGSAVGATNGVYLATEATSRWNVSAAGHLRPVATASYDLGTTTELVRAAYLGKIGNLTSNGLITTSAGDGTLGITALGSNVATFLTTPSSANLLAAVTDETGTGLLVFATSPTLTTPLLGTPTSGVLSNCTGYPTANLTGLGSNVATFLATPSSANLAAALTDETGSGLAVFQTSPTLVTPALGVATATSLNGNTFTAGTYTLTGAASKVLTFNNTLTLAGTDSTTMTFPSTSATIARTDAAQTFTGSQTIAALVGPVTITEAVGSSGLTVTGNTQVTSFPVLSLTQTWNASGTTFTAIDLNVTSTASASASLLLNLRVGTVSKYSVDKAGGITTASDVLFSGQCQLSNVAAINSSGLSVASTKIIGFSSTTNTSLAQDAFLMRGGAAATVQLGANLDGAAISQTLQACNGITSADRTGGNLTIASGKGTGAGAVSSLIFQTPAVLGSGSTAQSLVTRLTLVETMATFSGAVTITGATTLSSTLAANGTVTMGSGIGIATNTGTGTILATAASQKLGIWGAAAIVQPTTGIAAATFTANTSLIANDTATFDGYTLGQVVKALRNFGLLA